MTPSTRGEQIAVTGAAGLLGRAVVAHLIEHGYDVIALDRIAAEGVQSWDGRDLDVLRKAFRDCSAVIHLAAIPSPWNHPDEMIFANNTGATFAALTVAGELGIRRAVIASSMSAYGSAWSPHPMPSIYVPVDEDHPMLNADPYGLSKEVDERTAQMACRRWDLSVAALRFHWIADRGTQLARVAEFARDEQARAADVRHLWGYVDLRDAVRACRLAIEVAAEQPYGFVPMNIIAADSLLEQPIAELITEYAPQTELRTDLGPHGGAFAIQRAADVIGWRPEHSWRDAEEA